MTNEELILKLIETIQNLAPELWKILLKQAYTEAFAKMLWGIGFGFAAYKLNGIVKRYIPRKIKEEADKSYYYQQDDFVTWKIAASITACVILVLLAVGYIFSAIMWLYNPEFYAIRFILQSITH